MEDRLYKVGETTYNIPEKEKQSFLQDFPDAVEVESFVIDKDTFDIPLDERDMFLTDNPTAQPLKKKDISLQDAFTSASGKEELPFLG